jgi:hypothetical protein
MKPEASSRLYTRKKRSGKLLVGKRTECFLVGAVNPEWRDASLLLEQFMAITEDLGGKRMRIQSRCNTWVLVPIYMAFNDLTILVAFREFPQGVAGQKADPPNHIRFGGSAFSVHNFIVSVQHFIVVVRNFIVSVHNFIVAEQQPTVHEE